MSIYIPTIKLRQVFELLPKQCLPGASANQMEAPALTNRDKKLITNLKISLFLKVTPDFPSFDIYDSKIISRTWMAQFFNTAGENSFCR